MGQVLQFPLGNGALEVIADYFEEGNFSLQHELPEPDYFLAWLWMKGFKVVPVGDGD